MNMEDELTKPLGLQKARRGISLSRTVVPVLAAVIAGSAVGWYVQGQFRQAPPPPKAMETPETVEVPRSDQPAVQSGSETTNVRPDTVDETVPPRMEEAKPNGSMAEIKPVKQPDVRQEAALAHIPDPRVSQRSDTGLLPRRSEDGLRPMDVYSRPAATEGNFGVARVVIIVGGVGISQTSSQQAVQQLPPSITLAFAPYGNSLLRWMQEARKRGHELLVQIPMEPFDYPSNDPGPHTLTTGADASENLSNLHWSMSRITNYVGVTNFLGAKFVADAAAMKPVFEDLASRGVLFVDDGTARNSQTEKAAGESLLPFARASIVIDADRSPAAIDKQLSALEAEAKRTGIAIGIANAFPESIERIARFAESATGKGIEITPVSSVVSDPERKR
jgi:uncharacterized protein